MGASLASTSCFLRSQAMAEVLCIVRCMMATLKNIFSTGKILVASNAVETRPSALGMSDQIWGPLIHIFVDEKKIEKDKDLDQVNCEYTALRFLNF